MIVERFVINCGETKYKRQEYAQLLVLKQRADLALIEWDSLLDSDTMLSMVVEKNRALSDKEAYNFQQLQTLFKDMSHSTFEYLDLTDQYRFLYYQANVAIALLYFTPEYSDETKVSVKFFLEFFEHNKKNFDANWLDNKDIAWRNTLMKVNEKCLNSLHGIESGKPVISLKEKMILSQYFGDSLQDHPILGFCLETQL